MLDPTVKWRAYMGGRHLDSSVRFGLADRSTVFAAVGGRLLAKNVITQATLWSSELLGNGRVIDVADLDGDGRNEVVFATQEHAYILDISTGATRWTSPSDLFLTIAAVRVVDIDGDGLKDVYLDECAGCSKAGLAYAGAYSWGSGGASPTTLWVLPIAGTPPLVNSGSDGILDLDQDGVAEIALSADKEVLLLRGDSGTLIATLGTPDISGHPFGHANAVGAELDGAKPGLELLMIQTAGSVATEMGPPGFTAYHVNPRTGAWSLLWRATASNYDDELVTLADTVVDVDGDGESEVVLSFRAGADSTSWTTRLLNGATGAVIDELAGARFEGAADLDGVAGAELVLATSAGLGVYRLRSGALHPASPPIEGLRAASFVDPSLRQRSGIQRRLAVLQRTGCPPELLAGHPAGVTSFGTLTSVSTFKDIKSIRLTAEGWSVGATYEPLIGEVSEIVRADFATRPYSQVAVATTAGTLDVLTADLQTTNGLVWMDDRASGTVLGGGTQPSTGAYGGPLIAADAVGPLVVLPDTLRGMVVGDATSASWIIPPRERWSQRDLNHPSVIDLGGSLGPAVVGVEGSDLVARRSTDGALFGAVALGPGMAWGTPLPLAAAGRSPLVGIDWYLEGVQIAQHVADFTSGSLLWSGAPLPFGGFFASGVGDLDGDGTDEWYSMNGPLTRRDALSGLTTTYPELSTSYSIPMVAPLAGPAPSLLLQGGAASLKLADRALTLGWNTAVTEAINGMAGAFVTCGGGGRFVTPAVQSPTLRSFQGASGALTSERVLAGGKVYASIAAAVGAGARPGSLSNASAVAALGGGGPAVLVGSSDGFLYAVDACTLDLRWAKNMNAPVAEPVIGDVDGDGDDEIVVATSSGCVYGLDDVAYPAPLGIQVDGESADGVALADPTRPVRLSWSPVDGATGYEVALVGPDEWALWDPPYRPVTGTSMQVDLAGVLAERPYRLVVRARGAAAAGADGLSPRFRVVDTRPPTVVSVTPAAVAGGIEIQVESSDDLALDYAALTWREDGQSAQGTGTQTEAIFASEQRLSGKTATATLRWTAPAEARGKSVALTVLVVDSAGNSRENTLSGRVDESGFVTCGVEPEEAQGCACKLDRAPPTGSRPAAAAFAGAAVALLAMRRRRRARSAA